MSYSLSEFLHDFPNEEACIHYLYEKKHKNKKCPKCGAVGKYYRNRALPAYTCTCGEYLLYPRVGTFFEGTKLDLHKWFLIIFMASQGARTAKEIMGIAGTSYPTARIAQKKIYEVMYQNLKDKKHLEQWRGRAKAMFRAIEEEDIHLFFALFQFLQETEQAKKDPFPYLLSLILK